MKRKKEPENPNVDIPAHRSHRRCRATMHRASWQHGAPSLASATVADKASSGVGSSSLRFLLGEHPQVPTHANGRVG